MNIEEIKLNLAQFQASDKFKVYVDYQPAVENSTKETVDLVNDIFNTIAGELIHSLNGGSFNVQELKNILLQTPDVIRQEQLDTEDFEFCYELIIILSKIIGVDIQNELD